MNTIRFGFMWPGVEIANGTYNQTYLDLALNLVNAAGAGGIYSLIDAHEDVLSEKFCGEVCVIASSSKRESVVVMICRARLRGLLYQTCRTSPRYTASFMMYEHITHTAYCSRCTRRFPSIP